MSALRTAPLPAIEIIAADRLLEAQIARRRIARHRQVATTATLIAIAIAVAWCAILTGAA